MCCFCQPDNFLKFTNQSCHMLHNKAECTYEFTHHILKKNPKDFISRTGYHVPLSAVCKKYKKIEKQMQKNLKINRLLWKNTVWI